MAARSDGATSRSLDGHQASEHPHSTARERGRSNQHTDDFQQLRQDEVKEIWRRREDADPGSSKGMDTKSIPPDLVGLALSGGGVRAASVGLGALQALYNRDARLKELDYLSTVSGGGYIGGYLSSAAISSTATLDNALAVRPAAALRPSGNFKDFEFGLPLLVQRLIFGGKYLIRPWEAANKYLFGLLSINLVLVSGLLMLCALIAFGWRSLDYDASRDFLDLFYLNSDVVVAFFPFYFFAACWIIAWTFSYIKHEAEAPGKWAQRWLYFMVGSFFVGLTILLVNPETKVQFLRAFTGEGKIENTGTIARWLLGLIVAGLTPFLAPRALLKFGLNPQNIWQRVVFRVAMFALLVGVPLVVVGVLAKRNISGTARDAHDNLRAGDVYSWPAFLALLGSSDVPLDKQDEKELRDLKVKLAAQPAHHRDANYEANLLAVRNLARRELSGRVEELKEAMKTRTIAQERLDEHPARTDRFLYLLGWRVMDDNPMRDYWRSNCAVIALQNDVCQRFSDNVLGSRYLPHSIVQKRLLAPEPAVFSLDVLDANDSADDSDPNKKTQPKNVFARLAAALRQKETEKIKDSEIDNEELEEAQRSYTMWAPQSVKELNLGLLRAEHPECFFKPGKEYRQLVTAGDQVRRWWVFLASAIVFIVAATFVNINSTSLHRFYRNRLQHAYLVPHKVGRPDFALSSLNATAEGAPYHLINATIILTRPRFLDAVDAESTDLKADRRNVQTFLFSKLYCGSDATGWRRTEHYETFRDDNINVADAIALSGSAIDPLRSGSMGMATAMTALNLNLGQWMPNPRFERPALMPNFWVLWKDWMLNPVAASTYCYVSDGGFTDNLGIMSLLRRRCRLIIAVDASCDAKRSYVDLNWLVRAARIRYGIKLLEPVRDGDPEKLLDTSCLEPNSDGHCARHFVLARIQYPEQKGTDPPAWLVYLKPSFTGDEGVDLLKYRLEASQFPHDDTNDQFYEPARVESYRQLGFHIVDDFCRRFMGQPSLLAGMPGLEASLVGQTAEEPREPAHARTGEMCQRDGRYRSTCHHAVRNVARGEIFPRCPNRRGHDATWVEITEG